jgi:hypothetical protein
MNRQGNTLSCGKHMAVPDRRIERVLVERENE